VPIQRFVELVLFRHAKAVRDDVLKRRALLIGANDPPVNRVKRDAKHGAEDTIDFGEARGEGAVVGIIAFDRLDQCQRLFGAFKVPVARIVEFDPRDGGAGRGDRHLLKKPA
jgi:hypothetical protein